jgi:Domain of unknown function (DUF4124)
MKKVFATLLAIVAVSGTAAQGVYKSVGPDGKTTFSDQPPADGKNKSTVISAPSTRQQAALEPVTPRAGVDEAPGTLAPTTRDAKKASRTPAPTKEAAATENPIDAALLKALHTVAGHKLLVQHMRDTCIQTRPTAMGKYADAADHWAQRNSAIMAQQQRAMGDLLNASQRQKFGEAVKTSIDKLTSPYAAAAPAALFKWCDQSVAEINSGVMDLHTRQEVAAPLTAYRPR